MIKILLLLSLFSNAWGQNRPGGQAISPIPKAAKMSSKALLGAYAKHEASLIKDIKGKFQECGLGNPEGVNNIFDLRVRIILHSTNAKPEFHDLCPMHLSLCLTTPRVQRSINNLLETEDGLKFFLWEKDKTLTEKEKDSMVEFVKSLSVKKNEER